MLYRHLAAVLLLSLSARTTMAQDETVLRALTPEQLEKTLKAADIEFQKLADMKANTFFYDYKIKDLNLRLYYMDGKRLMLDTLFAALPLEKINEWNLGPTFSRAGLGKDDKGAAHTMVESHLNLKGGVTEAAINEFLNVFVEELDQFQNFARAARPRDDTPKEERAFKEVPADLLEKALTELKIKYAKAPAGSGGFAYEYQSGATKIVLTNWGKDMMLEAKFPKISLENVNQYNLDRKFIRAVSYNNKKGQYTGLEANMSFTGGVTESILRNFISIFEEDVREFALYVQKAAK
jgi:Putative bacterial sensory transduction regulator